MKKVFGFGIVALTLLATTSCKKDYTCTCKNGGTYSYNEVIKDSSKKDAETSCTEIQGKIKVLYPDANCSI